MPDQSGHGNILDKLVAWVAPERALRRQAARLMLRQYAAAKNTRLTGNWMPADPAAKDLVESSQASIRARVRQLVRDFPFFARAINVLVDLTVGTGIDFQARVKKQGGTYNARVNDQIEYAFQRWMEEADAAGKMHFNEIVRMSERTEIETGESLFVKRFVRGRFIPFAIQAIEPDRLGAYHVKPAGKNVIDNGIEYNPDTGQAIAYHILDDGYTLQSKRWPASDVIHTYHVLRPDQMRGISPFASAVLAADDLHQYIDATMDTAKLASKYLAMVTTSDIPTFQEQRAVNEGGQRVEELENAIIEYLNPGEDIKFANHNIPSDQFDPFTRFILRMVAVATGTSFELLSGDYSGLSYSNLKAIRADLVRGIKPRFTHRKNHFCNPVFRSFLQEAYLADRVSLPGYQADPYKYERCQWIWQGMESPDPLRESRAVAEQIKLGLMSPQEVVASRGRDLEEVLDEIAQAKTLMEDRKLIWGDVSASMSTNPASVDPASSDNEGGRMNKILRMRNEPDPEVTTRALPVYPATMDKENRSIEAVMATDAPVDVFTWEHGLVRETLLMSGAEYPDRLPLLDTHDRHSSKSVLGSVSNIHRSNDQIIGRVTFSKTASDIMTKVEEGHLTDFSVGYRAEKSVYIPDGETRAIGDRSFDGPMLVTTNWKIKELSICPIGADENAKARAMAESKNKLTEDFTMTISEELRKLLVARGMAADVTDEQAWAYLEDVTRQDAEPKEEPKAPEPVDTDKLRMEAIREERERVTEIHAMGEKFSMTDEARSAIENNVSLDNFRKSVLEAQMANDSGPKFKVEMGATEPEKVRAAIQDSLIVRGGLTLENPAPGHESFLGYTMREVAREMLVRAGQRIPQNAMEMIGRSLTSSDFPLALANVANKALFEGYNTAEETWRQWCGVGSVSDFKTHHLVRLSELDDLDEIPEAAEYKYGSRTEAEEQYKIATYGKLLMISRQALINDDMSALVDIPRAHGESAARRVGDLPYGVLAANAAMGDIVNLFDDGHSNQDTNDTVSVASLNNGFTKMALQTDLRGKRRLNIRPKYYIGPVATMGTVEQFFRTELIGGASNQPNLVNIYGGGMLTRIYEPRIDDDAADKWYLAGPKGKTVTVFFLNGVQTPYLETKQGWSVDGVEYKVRIDAGAKAVDWRALYLNRSA